MTVRLGDMLRAELRGWIEVVDVWPGGSFHGENWAGVSVWYDKHGKSVAGDQIIRWEVGTKPIGPVNPSNGLTGGGAKQRLEWHIAHGVPDGED